MNPTSHRRGPCHVSVWAPLRRTIQGCMHSEEDRRWRQPLRRRCSWVENLGSWVFKKGRHSDEGLEVGDHPLGRHPPLYAAHANKIMIASEQFQKEQFQTCNVIDSNNELQVIQCCWLGQPIRRFQQTRRALDWVRTISINLAQWSDFIQARRLTVHAMQGNNGSTWCEWE
jgi:hypothetical protein